MLNILIVDDEANIVKLVSHWAEKIGLKAWGFTDPIEAMKTFKKEDFQLVITDLKMPGMSGYELLKQVKSHSADIEVIIITGHGDLEDAIDAMHQDAYDFIKKPFVAKDLTQCMGRVIDKIILKEDNKHLLHDLRKMNQSLEAQVEKRTKELILKNRELGKLDELKSKFIACVSHELRTPLTQIDSGMYVLTSLLAKKTNESENKLLQIVQSGTRRLNSVIKNMTKILQAEYREGLLNKERVFVNKLVKEVCSELSCFVELRKQKMQCHLPEREICFEADEGKIRDILLNLCMNAVKFTPDGGELSVSLEDAANSFRFIIQDNGIGLSEEDKLHIFKRFYEAGDLMYHSSGTYQFKAGGLGLGLSIAKLFTEMHGGKISVESEGVNKGSTFIVELPLINSE